MIFETHNPQLAPLIDAKAASELLAIPLRTLERWRVERVGPPWIKLGRAVRYDVAELRRFIQQHRQIPSVSASMEDGSVRL